MSDAATEIKSSMVFVRSCRSAFGKDGMPALKCEPDGTIRANTFGPAKEWEEWILEPVGGGTANSDNIVAFKSCNTGKYLTAYPDGRVAAHAESVDKWEQWQIEVVVGEGSNMTFITIKSFHGKYLCCDDFFNCGHTVCANRDNANGEWEHWIFTHDRNAYTDPGHTAELATRIGGATLLAGGGLVATAALAIPLVGFGVGGVAAGSMAAAAQSAFYGGATTGVFSVLQSIGATAAWAPAAGYGAAAAATGGGVLIQNQKGKNSKEKRNEKHQ